MKKEIPCRVQTAGQGIFIGKMTETYFAGNRKGISIQPDKMFHVKQCGKCRQYREKLPVRIPGKVFCQKSSAGDCLGFLLLQGRMQEKRTAVHSRGKDVRIFSA